jgi:hypothetical protein
VQVLFGARDRDGGERRRPRRAALRATGTAFVTGKLQSLCEPCYRSAKRQIELRGYRYDVGIDGYPIDPNHPFNRAGGSD